ncbi:PREDICTED: selenium-binding protein 1 isoform X2 [Eufriesea mexicana]|uniref:selenium-binding protein 1 isoform X2 n=1 Tax=Eufriesea mexicana TaxID=516756 RepID=UPI00083BF111|nr:PREDICTED: selenium-binding protein 1 isoform X2 [Eufriesea mexicana]XP_017767163.1 PREDICTED: selenium-binding protein 1 isoform X2 [Eufriesea mexicana]XP_017767164.1 PREDICTED: selenium-binding protein 1 isoform X2 [Eufriesea mexicana]
MFKNQGSSGCSGPGYKSPKAAILEGPREKLMYVVCVHTDSNKSDVLCTVDIDPTSDDYCKIIHKLRMPYVGDELHHSGWNICSSCHGQSQKRNTLVLPCLMSDRVYFIDTTNERAPSMKKVLNSTEINQYGVSTLHTSHCSPNREILISTLGKPNGDAMGEFLCIDAETLKVKGTWSTGTKRAMFGYDFWYQPYHDVLVATEWGVPRIFKRGYAITDSYDPAIYGRSLNFYSWNKRELKQVLNLGEDGIAPLEIRFLHDPKASEGFVGCAVTSNVYKFYKTSNAEWIAKKVIQIPPKQVEGWIAPQMSGMITDILISLDDKYLYLSNWLHGDVRQYDISDTENAKLTGQIFLGGSILRDSKIRVIRDVELANQPNPIYVKGRRLYGSPQMLQLSLDGTRLYVTTSIFKPWDQQFYPEHVKYGSTMIKLDVDVINGGLKLDEEFLVDFGKEKNDILLAHEMRYPGGDCTSDIWLSVD